MITILSAFFFVVLANGERIAPKNITDDIANLWDLDINRCVLGVDYMLDPQMSIKDNPTRKPLKNLIKLVNLTELTARYPTYDALVKLFPIYHSRIGIPEEIDTNKDEARLVDNFLNSVIRTPVMEYLKNVFVERKLISDDIQALKNLLHEMWFSLYKRKARDDSSGFEHVFIGEVKGKLVLGSHNWIHYAMIQEQEQVEYYGHYGDICDHIGTFSFLWEPIYWKKTGTIMIGVSPEYELALYTLVFHSEHKHLPVIYDNRCRATITCFDQNENSKQVGTCYNRTTG